MALKRSNRTREEPMVVTTPDQAVGATWVNHQMTMMDMVNSEQRLIKSNEVIHVQDMTRKIEKMMATDETENRQ